MWTFRRWITWGLHVSPSHIIFIACGWGKYETFPEPACYKCIIIPNEPKKTHTWKILLANIFGALSQTFKNHIHNKWCVPSASDVFLSKSVNSGRKMREASEGVAYDFYFTEYDFCPVWSRVLIFAYCPIKLIYLW
jgi:hypothetical protein